MTNFFQITAADWLLETQRLTLEERGAFIQILAAICHKGGFIENDSHYLSLIMRCSKRKAAALTESLRDKNFIEFVECGQLIKVLEIPKQPRKAK